MDDLKLREALRPLANALTPASALDAERKVREGFRADGTIHRELITEALPLQRIDWIVPPSAAAGVQNGRYYVPENIRIVRLAMVSTANAASTFQASVRVNGSDRVQGSIRVGTDRGGGTASVNAPAGSVISIETKDSIAQGVTVSVFYRPQEV